MGIGHEQGTDALGSRITRRKSGQAPEVAARELLAASQQILDHLRNGRAVAVDRAQTRCQRALENYW